MKKSNSTRLRKNIVNKKVLLPLGALTIIVISGLYFTQQHEGQNASRRSTAEPVTAIPAGLLTLQDVESIVTTTKADEARTISAIELGNEDGSLVYKVRLSDGSIRYINALTGTEALHYSHDVTDTEDSDDSTLPAGFVPGIGFAAARDTALANYSTGEINRIKLETEDGRAVYSVRFTDKHRVDVDAQSGTIVKIKQAKTERTDDSQPGSQPRSHRNSSGRERPEGQSRRDDSRSQDRRSDDSRRDDSDDDSSDNSHNRESDDDDKSDD